MTIARASFISGLNPFSNALREMTVDEDLFASLLGGLSKPYEIIRKKTYDYALLDDGIDKAAGEFLVAVKGAMDASMSGGEGLSIVHLNRPLIIHAKSDECAKPSVVKMIEELQAGLKASGRGLVVYPALDVLSSLGGALARDLRSALKLTGVVPPLTVDSEITESFCRATRELYEIQLKTPVKFTGASIRTPGIRHDGCHSGAIDLEGGSVTVTAMVTLPENSIPELMKRMTGLPQIPEDLLRNGPAEFANIIGGAARGNLNSAGYALRSPSIPKMYGPEKQHLLAAADSSIAIEVRLETALGEGFLEIRFYS
jgi:hypothetical protein